MIGLLKYFAGLAFLILVSCSAPNNNPYNLDLINTLDSYQETISQDSMKKFVDLEDYIPGIVLDIRYATKNNFTGEQIYRQPKAFVRLPVAMALLKVQQELNKEGLGLKIYDAYRPYAATLKFYDVLPDTMFVAAPWHGSRHNRGCAVDVSLVDLSTGKELEMPSAFDDFSEKAWPSNHKVSEAVRNNCDLLINTMKNHGFTVYPYEWWHYDYEGWEEYKLVDLSFEELDRKNN